MNKQINILVMVNDRWGCGLFRCLQPHQYIQEHYPELFEIEIRYHLPNDVNLEDFFKRFDIVCIHKQLDNERKIADLIKSCGCKLVVDIDDHWTLGPDHPMGETAKREGWHIPVINHLKIADMVTTTTDIFANIIKKHNKNICVLPNAIDINDYRFKIDNKKSDRLRFGIICSATHLKDVELMSGMISQLSKDILDKIQIVLCGFDTRGTRQVFNIDTQKWETKTFAPEETTWYKYEKILTNNHKIISDDYKKWLHLFDKENEYDCTNEPYRRCWTKNTYEYYKHYENIDVLLIPLKVNDFNIVKSQLKVVEAGFAHKAIIANNVGPYTIDLTSMIEKGGKINENGNALLIEPSKNHKLWAKYITKLVEDRDMLEKLKTNLHNTVKDTYSLDTVCKKRVDMYLKLMNRI